MKGNVWMAKYSDPKIIALFNTDTIATAFTSNCEPGKVLKIVTGLNPECIVSLDDDAIEAYYDADPVRNEWNGIPHPSEMESDPWERIPSAPEMERGD